MSDRYPFSPYPNGWFRVASSKDLAVGAVLPLEFLGRDLVAFRDEAGAAHVLDAHCPHLGAHLGYGGAVVGDTIRCPFHGWRYDGKGQCVEVPYAKRIPPTALIRAWPLVEEAGFLFVWHHERDEVPTFALPELPHYGDADWTPFTSLHWKVRAAWLDMNENAVDQVHFKYVHGARTIPETDAEIDGHILRCRSRMKLGTPRGPVEGGIDTTDYGPGLQTVHLTGIVETWMVNTATPIDDEYTDVVFAYSVRKSDGGDTAKGVGAAIIRDLEHQMNQDIPIWENKKYWTAPKLAEGDGPLAVYRRWMKQFFCEETARG